MESLMEKVLYEGAVEFKSRTYGADASLTEMLYIGPKKDFDARPIDGGFSGSSFGGTSTTGGLDIGHKPMEPPRLKEKEIEGPGSVARNQYELEEGWKIQERFDYSGHGGSEPHVNYELVNPQGSVIKPKSALKKFMDDMHKVDLLDY